MKRIGQVLLGLGVLGALLGIAYGLRASAIADAERRQQAQVGRIAFRLARSSDWASTSFVPGRSGSFAVVLESADPTGPPSERAFDGSAEIEVIDPAGRSVLRRTLDGRTIYHRVPTGIVYTGAGSVEVGTAPSGSWTLRVRVERPDPEFERSRDVVYLQTPPRFDTGWYMFGVVAVVIVSLVASGTLALVGGVLWSVAARRARGTL
jgi:hypothetical protein